MTIIALRLSGQKILREGKDGRRPEKGGWGVGANASTYHRARAFELTGQLL
jgi:hypothetical protein